MIRRGEIRAICAELKTREDFDVWLKSKGISGVMFNESMTYFQKLRELKKYYLSKEADLSLDPYSWFDPHACNWEKLMTPIEFKAWQDIRFKGQIVMYPQYPALNYFLDFANPGLKIGLELDGKHFHNKDNDQRRDAALNKAGWKIYRITGKEITRTDFKLLSEITDGTNLLYNYDECIEHLKYWLLETGDGVIESITQVHFAGERSFYDYQLSREFWDLCNQTLEKHRSYGTH